MTKLLLIHTPQSRLQFYGERSLSGLQAMAQVVLHEADDALDATGLARMEMRAIFSELLRRIDSVELIGRARRAHSTFMTGITSLPVRCTFRRSRKRAIAQPAR